MTHKLEVYRYLSYFDHAGKVDSGVGVSENIAILVDYLLVKFPKITKLHILSLLTDCHIQGDDDEKTLLNYLDEKHVCLKCPVVLKSVEKSIDKAIEHGLIYDELVEY